MAFVLNPSTELKKSRQCLSILAGVTMNRFFVVVILSTLVGVAAQADEIPVEMKLVYVRYIGQKPTVLQYLNGQDAPKLDLTKGQEAKIKKLAYRLDTQLVALTNKYNLGDQRTFIGDFSGVRRYQPHFKREDAEHLKKIVTKARSDTWNVLTAKQQRLFVEFSFVAEDHNAFKYPETLFYFDLSDIQKSKIQKVLSQASIRKKRIFDMYMPSREELEKHRKRQKEWKERLKRKAEIARVPGLAESRPSWWNLKFAPDARDRKVIRKTIQMLTYPQIKEALNEKQFKQFDEMWSRAKLER